MKLNGFHSPLWKNYDRVWCLIGIVGLIRELNWIFRSFVATVILGGALYIATEHSDSFIVQWMKIFGGILIYTLILAPDSDK